MSILYACLFGKFNAWYGDQILTGLDASKVRELFCYLLLYRQQPHSREALAGLLWDEGSSAQPQRCLRKALWQLRSVLDSPGEPLGNRLLLIEPDWIQISPEADLWLDVAVFEQAFARVQGMPGRHLDSQCVQSLKNAVDLYRGGLQESWYQDWYLFERERLQHIHVIMLDKLMGYCEACQDYEAGLVYGSLILRNDRARERTHRRLMRLQYLVGDRTAALRQYESCVAALDEELGVKPAKRTLALYQQIRADQLNEPAPAPVQAREPEAAASPLPEVLDHLKQLQTTLIDIQRQVHHDIQAVELAINGRG